MPKYPVKEPLNHDHKDYTAGDLVEMTEEQAAALIVLEVIGESPGELSIPQAARAVIAQIKMTMDVAELDQLEADNQDRKSVLDAIEKRRQELAG